MAAGIWTNKVLQAMDLPLLPLVTSVEQQTYYNTPTGAREVPRGLGGLASAKWFLFSYGGRSFVYLSS